VVHREDRTPGESGQELGGEFAGPRAEFEDANLLVPTVGRRVEDGVVEFVVSGHDGLDTGVVDARVREHFAGLLHEPPLFTPYTYAFHGIIPPDGDYFRTAYSGRNRPHL